MADRAANVLCGILGGFFFATALAALTIKPDPRWMLFLANGAVFCAVAIYRAVRA